MSGHLDPLLQMLSPEAVASLEQASALAELTGPRFKTWFVGKHGSNNNDGKTPAGAFLTFAKATASAASGDVIQCLDSGTYNESVNLPNGVHLFAPFAIIQSPGGGGTGVGCVMTNGGDVLVRVHRLIPGAGESGVVQKDFAGVLNLDCDYIDGRVNGGGDGLLNLSTTAGGVMMARVRSIWVPAGGVGVGDLAVNLGHTHLDVGDIYLSGDGAIGIFLATSTKIVGRVDHIVELGTHTGTKGIEVSTGTANLNVSDITADTSYNVVAGAVLNMFVNQLTGAVGPGTGTANVSTP